MKAKPLIFTALFIAITAVCAQIIIPIPFSPVPLSLCLMGVFLTGALLPKREAVLTQMAYLLLGAAGAPVFSGFGGGFAKVAGPTGGYLVAYPLMVLIIAWMTERQSLRSFGGYCLSMGLSLLVCYLFGTIWLCLMGRMSVAAALMAAVVPFLPLDCVKIVLTALFASALQKRLPILGSGRLRL